MIVVVGENYPRFVHYRGHFYELKSEIDHASITQVLIPGYYDEVVCHKAGKQTIPGSVTIPANVDIQTSSAGGPMTIGEGKVTLC